MDQIINVPIDTADKGRIAYLDALRCLAIFCVVEGHVWILGMGFSSYDMLSGLMLYTFNIPLFFFTSGFFAYKPEMTAKCVRVCIKNKFLLLVIPAVVFRTVLNLQTHASVLDPISHGFGKYWFTITLFECFLVYYSLQLCFKNERIRTTILVIVSLLFIVMLSIYGEIGPRILDFNHLFKYFYFFVMGIIARNFEKQYYIFIKNDYSKTFIIGGFFLLLFTINYPIWPSPIFHFLRDIVLRVLGTLTILMLFVSNSSYFEKKTKANSIIMRIGQYSLPIYLLQYFFIPDFLAFKDWINELDEFTIHLISIIYTVFIIIACLTFIRVLEQSKLIRKYFLGIK